jgi:hypothetical protein
MPSTRPITLQSDNPRLLSSNESIRLLSLSLKLAINQDLTEEDKKELEEMGFRAV